MDINSTLISLGFCLFLNTSIRILWICSKRVKRKLFWTGNMDEVQVTSDVPSNSYTWNNSQEHLTWKICIGDTTEWNGCSNEASTWSYHSNWYLLLSLTIVLSCDFTLHLYNRWQKDNFVFYISSLPFKTLKKIIYIIWCRIKIFFLIAGNFKQIYIYK